MHHDWIIDVLEDLRAYARDNDLSQVAKAADEALSVARAELAEKMAHGSLAAAAQGRPN